MAEIPLGFLFGTPANPERIQIIQPSVDDPSRTGEAGYAGSSSAQIHQP